MLPAFDFPAFEVESAANFAPAFDRAALLGFLWPFAMMCTSLRWLLFVETTRFESLNQNPARGHCHSRLPSVRLSLLIVRVKHQLQPLVLPQPSQT